MTRTLTVFGLALLTACAVEAPVDDMPVLEFERHQDQQPASPEAKALVSVAYAQSDVESVLELGILDVFSEDPYPAHEGLASCIHVPVPEEITWLVGDCDEDGSWGYEIVLDQCTLGPGDPVSGTIQVSYDLMADLDLQATPEQLHEAIGELNKARNNNELSMQVDMWLAAHEDRPIRACGTWSGAAEEHMTEFDALVPMPNQGTAYLHWSGHGSNYYTEESRRIFVRDGRLNARVEARDGAVHTLAVGVRDNLRREWARFPERGGVKVAGRHTAMEYLPSTRYTGEVRITEPNGVVRTHYLRMRD